MYCITKLNVLNEFRVNPKFWCIDFHDSLILKSFLLVPLIEQSYLAKVLEIVYVFANVSE